MNKLAILFGTTTVAFAGLTFYYASELKKENARFDAWSTQVRAAPAPSGRSPASPAQSTPEPEVPAPASNTPVVKASVPNTISPAASTAAVAASKPELKLSASDVDFLRMYANPEGRRTLIEEAMVDQRNIRRGLAEELHLTEEHWQRVLEVFAEQQLESRAASLRCRADPTCRSLFTPEQRAINEQALRDVIGGDKYDDYEAYVRTQYERQTVAALQRQLSGALSLPADRVEALIAALAEEREAALRDMTANGEQYSGIGVPSGFIYYSASAPTLEARMASGVQYSQRMRERAATVLNANQLATFNQLQDQLVATLRSHIARQQPPTPKPQPPKPQKSEQRTAQT